MSKARPIHYAGIILLLAAFGIQAEGNFTYFVADVQTAFMGSFLLGIVMKIAWK